MQIDDPSVSRQHALLRVGQSGVLQIEDLGGANGTQVQLRRSRRLGETESLTPLRNSSLPVSVGDRVLFGSVPAIIQRFAPMAFAAGPIVADPRMSALYADLDRVAVSSISVLLLGETGTGKEVLARTLHARSKRASGPFISINCAALTETLLEAELFGHERGAFTGATHARAGLFEAADGGTLFLDELGELSVSTQAKLLRILEGRKVVRVGSTTERAFDARFVSATNIDLEAKTEVRDFRTDLYFRLASCVLKIPPLRERVSEVAPFARAFIAQACTELDGPVLDLAPETLTVLERYAWPGNIRELKNAMQRAAALARGSQILPEHLPERLGRIHASIAPTVTAAPTANGDELTRLRDQISEVDRLRIVDALERCSGNQTRAARELGISRRTLVNRMQAYDLPRPRKP